MWFEDCVKFVYAERDGNCCELQAVIRAEAENKNDTFCNEKKLCPKRDRVLCGKLFCYDM